MDRGSRPHSPSSTLILPYPYASLHLLRAPSHPSPSISHPFRWIMHRYSYLSLLSPLFLSLSLHRLPSIEISKNRSDFSSIFHNPPFHLIFDHNIHSHSINYIYSFLFFFPLPQHFHSLDRWRAIVILFPSPHSLTSPTPLPSPSSIRTTQSSASIDLLRERSRKSRFRERETSEVEMRSEKEQLGDKLEKG